ncbi:MAG: hypothetical protein COB07_09135 [Sulfurovum sp.]|nr:MAG: hypothetical protein COB07_09135 [Sulfurovum sp.]
MKLLLLLFIVFHISACTTEVKSNQTSLIKNHTRTPIKKSTQNSFYDVWHQITSDPYTTLPQHTVAYGKLFTWKRNIILEDSKRTLEEHSDILAPFDKLAHPNGICLKGFWNIHTENPYSGYFKQGSKALIIVRASSAMSNTHRGEIRSFGFAGKLFPSLNPKKINKENTANFFLIDDLGGTDAPHYTDVTLTNEPSTTITSTLLKNSLYGLKIASAFSESDKHPGIRQLYEISELGEKKGAHIITAKWMKVEAKEGQTVDASDFRDELEIKNNKKLVFIISVASKEDTQGIKEWQSIGTITLDASTVSTSCDHRLHFHHPKWRSDLDYGEL